MRGRRGVAREQDERAAGVEQREVDLRRGRQRVVRGEERAERPADRRAGLQQRVVERAAHERDVDAPVDERRHELGGGLLDREHADVRPPRRRAAPRASATAPAGTSGETPSRSAPVSPVRIRATTLSSCSTRSTTPRASSSSSAPAGRELDPARRTDEQLDAERRLERLDPLAERRLGDVEPLGGPAEVQLLGDGDEVAQVPQEVHRGRIMTQHG